MDAFATQMINYSPQNGRLALPRGFEESADLLAALSKTFSYTSVHLSFSELRGFLDFQKQARWNELSVDLRGVQRWMVEGGKTWGIFAQTAPPLIAFIDPARTKLASGSFQFGTPVDHVPTLIEVARAQGAITVTYVTPGTEADKGTDGGHA